MEAVMPWACLDYRGEDCAQAVLQSHKYQPLRELNVRGWASGRGLHFGPLKINSKPRSPPQ